MNIPRMPGMGNPGATTGDTPQVDTAEQVQISSLALLKMLKHGATLRSWRKKLGGIDEMKISSADRLSPPAAALPPSVVVHDARVAEREGGGVEEEYHGFLPDAYRGRECCASRHILGTLTRSLGCVGTLGKRNVRAR